MLFLLYHTFYLCAININKYIDHIVAALRRENGQRQNAHEQRGRRQKTTKQGRKRDASLYGIRTATIKLRKDKPFLRIKRKSSNKGDGRVRIIGGKIRYNLHGHQFLHNKFTELKKLPYCFGRLRRQLLKANAAYNEQTKRIRQKIKPSRQAIKPPTKSEKTSFGSGDKFLQNIARENIRTVRPARCKLVCQCALSFSVCGEGAVYKSLLLYRVSPSESTCEAMYFTPAL